MKIVINIDYGGISDESAALRTDPNFIEQVESGMFTGRSSKTYGGFTETLQVISIPDGISDYHVIDYDGCEGVIYVLDGKLYYKGTEECRRVYGY